MASIYLTGFMASGKSYTGRQLAELLGREFLDLDDAIEQETGTTISELFGTRGEEYFRRLERNALRQTASMSGLVVATGGGAPCFHGGMDWMNATGVTVFLDPSLGVLLERLNAERIHRPLVREAVDLEASVRQRLSARRPVYEKARIHLRPTHPKAATGRLLADYFRSAGGARMLSGA